MPDLTTLHVSETEFRAAPATSAGAAGAGARGLLDRPVVSAVVVSYNTRALTTECLRSLYADLGDLPAEVFVVDNASTDGSAAAVAAAFPQAIVVPSRENLGFGRANNVAMDRATGQYLLLINSDAFPKTGAVAAMVDYLKGHPRCAVVGPRLLNGDGSLQPSCYRFPTPTRSWLENLWIAAAAGNHPVLGDYRRWPHDAERSVDFVSGACLLVRRDAYDEVGGFDPAFFMYSEETDWMWRFKRHGWDVCFTPAAEVTHLGGSSGAAERAKINRHFFESLDYYELKHHGLGGLVSLRLAMAVGCAARAVLWAGVLVAVPKKRQQAKAKTRLLSWLVVRQLTHWKLPERSPASPLARRLVAEEVIGDA